MARLNKPRNDKFSRDFILRKGKCKVSHGRQALRCLAKKINVCARC